MSLLVFPQLPTMEWNSTKKQKWNTKIQKSGSGRRKSLALWSYPEWEIRCSYKALNPDHIEDAAGFCAQVRGQHQPFLWLDPEDYRQTGVRIGVGAGAQTQFYLIRNLANRYVEPVTDVVPGTLTVYEDGVPVSFVMGDDGLIILQAPAVTGAAITASFDYYWRVAFANDDIDWSNFWYNYYKLNTIAMVTVK